MPWMLVGAGLLLYQILAVWAGKPRVSSLGHHWPWAVLIWGWLLTLGAHLILTSARERQAGLRRTRGQ